MKESFKSLSALSNFFSYVSVMKLLRTSDLAVLYLGWEEKCFQSFPSFMVSSFLKLNLEFVEIIPLF